MGYGDELMVAGEAKLRAGNAATRFAVPEPRKGFKPIRWSEVWLGNPRMAKPGEPYDDIIENYPGCRPYIKEKRGSQWVWRAYQPEPAEYFVQPGREEELRKLAAGAIVVNPHIKSVASSNKTYPLDRWQELVDREPNIKWLQVGQRPLLRRVPHIVTYSFREAVAVLSGARALVTHEGGLHHAAAAVGVPAVVIFGGFISPRVTGYAQHVNLYEDSENYPLGCGMRVSCRHCNNAMHNIRAVDVLKRLKAMMT